MRIPLALTTVLLLLLPSVLAVAPAADPAPFAAGALRDAASLTTTALSFEGALSAQLMAVTGAAPAPVPAASFDEALGALYDAAGLALPATYARPEPELAAALAPVLAAAALSARETEAAFAGLSPEERAFFDAHLPLLLSPARSGEADLATERVQLLAARVEMPRIAAGAAALTAALDGFPRSLASPTSWSDPNGLLEVGSTGPDVYCTERNLIIDLGGNDEYRCHPAAYAPGSTLQLPVSAILDLGGNDLYATDDLHASSLVATWGQGVGISGVGLIVDRWGDDRYTTTLVDRASWCAADFMTGAPQTIYAQGVGAAGIGAIFDASGNDVYEALNTNSVKNFCHFSWVYTFAQGAGLVGGAGLLVDDTGDDSYIARSYSVGKADNIASVFAQAVAANGIGALVDKEGNDLYDAGSESEITFGYTKGAFAYTFAQASVAGTRKQPAVGAPPGLLPITTDDLAGRGLCPNASPGGAATLGGGACDGAGAALLVDILGDDIFDANAYADDYGRGCSNGLWSVVSAQGSAAWTGVAALVNLDITGSDAFTLTAIANGDHCGGPGVRSHAYGQGYAGPVLWDFWDLPQPAGVEQHPVGILASLGVPEETCPGSLRPPPKLPVDGPVALPLDSDVLDRVGTPKDPCLHTSAVPALTASPDEYVVRTSASNPRYIANAEAWMQGASRASITIPAYARATYPTQGIGLLIDIGGDDGHQAQADANGPLPDALVVGQGATVGSYAGLANVGGSDAYAADAQHVGVAQPARTLVQGYADAPPGGPSTPPICVAPTLFTFCLNPTPIPTAGGLALFLEVFGYDGYSEAVERTGCHTNGDLQGTWPIGLPLGTAWWGHVFGHPCSTPATGTGSGTVIGLDWASDAW